MKLLSQYFHCTATFLIQQKAYIVAFDLFLSWTVGIVLEMIQAVFWHRMFPHGAPILDICDSLSHMNTFEKLLLSFCVASNTQAFLYMSTVMIFPIILVVDFPGRP